MRGEFLDLAFLPRARIVIHPGVARRRAGIIDASFR
jgi:hypothetical protein